MPSPNGARRHHSYRQVSFGLMVVALAVVSASAVMVPINDVDAYWHVRIGEEILATGQTSNLGDDWAWYTPAEPWVTSQWLAEVIMAALVRFAGWAGLVYAAAAGAFLAVLLGLWTISKRASGLAMLPPATGLVSIVLFSVAARPATASLVGLVFVAHIAERTLRTGPTASWWLVPMVVVWANVHGMWIVAPLALGVATVSHWLDRPAERLKPLLRGMGYVAVLLAAGCLTPLGLDGLTFSLRLRGAVDHLQEWQLTTPWSVAFIPLAIVIATVLVAGVRSGLLTKRSIAFYGVFWVLFSLPALRNVIVSTLMLVPLAATLAGSVESSMRAQPADENRRLLAAGVVAVAVAFSALVFAVIRLDPLAEAKPMTIAQSLRERYSTVSILNNYNTAGVLLAFGPEKPVLGIDGRAERYGTDYINDYLDVHSMTGQDWPSFLWEFDPEVAVVHEDAPIRYHLEETRGWRLTVREDPFVLLEHGQGSGERLIPNPGLSWQSVAATQMRNWRTGAD